MIRPQYHLRNSPRGLLAWDVRRLVRLAQGLPVRQVPVDSIAELDTDHWYFQGGVPTPRSIVAHCRLILDADTVWPVILDTNGRVMDGMHRICGRLLEGASFVDAVQFSVDPEPDFVGVAADDLPYGD